MFQCKWKVPLLWVLTSHTRQQGLGAQGRATHIWARHQREKSGTAQGLIIPFEDTSPTPKDFPITPTNDDILRAKPFTHGTVGPQYPSSQGWGRAEMEAVIVRDVWTWTLDELWSYSILNLDYPRKQSVAQHRPSGCSHGPWGSCLIFFCSISLLSLLREQGLPM